MTQKSEIYVCDICGNIVETLDDAKGELVCCGQPMTLQRANTIDASHEKHVPVVTKEGNRIKVKIGSIPHPMQPEHFIQWIELIQGSKVKRTELKPGDQPEAEFCVDENDFIVRAYCNLHGLWANQE